MTLLLKKKFIWGHISNYYSTFHETALGNCAFIFLTKVTVRNYYFIFELKSQLAATNYFIFEIKLQLAITFFNLD